MRSSGACLRIALFFCVKRCSIVGFLSASGMLENSTLGEKAKSKVMVCCNENTFSAEEPQGTNGVGWGSGSLQMTDVPSKTIPFSKPAERKESTYGI